MSTLVRREALLVAALATTGLSLLLPCARAQAQVPSAYTMTVLAKPAGAHTFAPTSLAGDGTVRGGMTYWAGFGVDPTFACVIFCNAYLPREVNWGKGTGATAAAAAGQRGFFPVRANERGTLAGRYTEEKKVLGRYFLVPSSTDAQRAVDLISDYPATHVRLPGEAAALLLPPVPGVNEFVAWDINNDDVIVGSNITQKLPLVWRQGATAALPFDPYRVAKATGVNDAGLIVGTVQDANGVDRVAFWRDGQLSVAGDDTAERHPKAINNAGQVLLLDSPGFGQVAERGGILANGQITNIVDPRGRSVAPTAFNDSGTVVGCTQAVKPLLSIVRTDFEPFIWRNGVLADLTQELAAKGVALPAGTRWGCPTAINNQGSMLIYHYKTSAPDKVTWVKINARP